MTRTATALLLGLSLLVCVVLFDHFRRAEQTATPDWREWTQQNSTPTDRTRARRETLSRSPQQGEPVRVLSLRGQVRNASDNTIVAGARIALHPGPTLASFDTTATAITGSDGTFTLRVPQEVSMHTGGYFASVTATGYSPWMTTTAAVPLSGDYELPTVALTAGRTVSGVVVDPAGNPVSDGFVIVEHHRLPQHKDAPILDLTTTKPSLVTVAANGSFLTWSPATHVRLAAVVPGFAPSQTEALPTTEAHDLTVQLRPEPMRRLTVVDNFGAPLAGVTVAQSRRRPTRPLDDNYLPLPGLATLTLLGETNVDGLLLLRIEDDAAQRLYLTHPEHLVVARDEVAADGPTIEATMVRGAWVSFALVDGDGFALPITEGVVIAFGDREDLACTKVGTRWRSQAVPAHAGTVTISVQGFVPMTLPWDAQLGENDLGTLVPSLGNGIELTVTDTRGVPVPDAWVTLPDASIRTRTDRQGRVVQGGLLGASTDVRISALDYVPITRRVGLEGGRPTPLTVQLSRGATVEGRVRTPAAGGAITVRVFANNDSQAIEVENVAGNASFRIDRIPIGVPATIQVVAAGAGSVELPLEPFTDEEVRALDPIQLNPGSWVEGTIRDARGSPVPGARVHVLSRGDPVLQGRSARSNEEGAYVISGLAAGVHRLSVDVDTEFLEPRDVEFRVTDAGFVVRDVTLHRSVTWSGSVTDSAGAPVAGATVTLLQRAGRGRHSSALSRADGTFKIERLLDASAHATVSFAGRTQTFVAPSIAQLPRQIEVQAAALLSLQIEMIADDVPPANVRLELLGHADAGTGQLAVAGSAHDFGGRPRSETSGLAHYTSLARVSQGRALFTELLAGDFQIIARAEGYEESQPVTVGLTAGDSTQAVVAMRMLRRHDAKFIVTDAVTGQRVPDASIFVGASVNPTRRTDENGECTHTVLSSRFREFSVTASGFRNYSGHVYPDTNGHRQFQVTLQPEITVDVLLTNTSGTAATAVEVTASRRSLDPIADRYQDDWASWHFTASGQSGADGVATVRGLRSGIYDLSFQMQGSPVFDEITIEVDGPGYYKVAHRLPSLEPFRGSVLIGDVPAQGQVLLTLPGAPAADLYHSRVAAAFLDAGHFEFLLPPGTEYMLHYVGSDAPSSYPTPVSTATKDFALIVTMHDLEIEVLAADGRPLAGALVHVVPEQGGGKSLYSDALGRARFQALPGRFSVCAEPPGGNVVFVPQPVQVDGPQLVTLRGHQRRNVKLQIETTLDRRGYDKVRFDVVHSSGLVLASGRLPVLTFPVADVDQVVQVIAYGTGAPELEPAVEVGFVRIGHEAWPAQIPVDLVAGRQVPIAGRVTGLINFFGAANTVPPSHAFEIQSEQLPTGRISWHLTAWGPLVLPIGDFLITQSDASGSTRSTPLQIAPAPAPVAELHLGQ